MTLRSARTASAVAILVSGFLVGTFGVEPALAAPDDPVGVPIVVNEESAGNQREPAIATASDGSSIVVWQSYGQDGDYFGIYGRRLDALGQPMGPEFLVNNQTARSQEAPDVAMADDGRFVVVWEDIDYDAGGVSPPKQVFGRRFSPDGAAQGNQFRITVPSGTKDTSPSVAVGPIGEFAVLWWSAGTAHLQRYSPEGALVGDRIRLHQQIWNTQVQQVVLPWDVVVDASGRVTAVHVVASAIWGKNGTYLGGSGILVATQIDPAKKEPISQVTIASGDDTPSRASIGADSMGRVTVLWTQSSMFHAQQFAPGLLAVGDVFQVDEEVHLSARAPELSVAPDGSFVVTWERYDPETTAAEVRARRFLPSATPAGASFTVLIAGSAFGVAPSVAMMDDGGYIIATDNYSPEPFALFEVFAVRYEGPS